MRLAISVVLVAAPFLTFSSLMTAQQATGSAPSAKIRPAGSARTADSPAASDSIKDLPVRKVVLYKNGVGYFEHAGAVNGNQRLTIDFTSSQLNDVLQSLTVLDQGGGHIAGVNYNSTTPIQEQLQKLALGLTDFPPATAIYQALRGQRVEVTGGGATVTGRLVNIEFRKETDKNGATSEDHYFLIVDTDEGALRTTELTDAVSVRMIDPSLQKQFADYLRIIASSQNQQERHLTLDALGQGQRQIEVSYISSVPVWKSTYRMVFPRDASANAILQGWAVVDNTVGADWDNVQLSLVAGAPQSFIQPLSQPIYTQRPQVPIALAQQIMPETHEAAEMYLEQRSVNSDLKGRYPGSTNESVAVSAAPVAALQTLSANVSNGIGTGAGMGGNVGGGVYRASDALQPGDVASKAFDDYFEYALTQPVTIRKNESAMVPILEQELPAEHVTLWSEKQRAPLRAVWLENKSKLTLDAGSFSIFENGEFAGEGLLDPIHPGEKRLLSYAVDQAVKVQNGNFAEGRRLQHVSMRKGILIRTTEEVNGTQYSVNNTSDEARTVIVEHPRISDAELESDAKPAETTATTYRFRVTVEAHRSASLRVAQRSTVYSQIQINPDNDQTEVLIRTAKYTPELEAKLRPLVDAETALSDLNGKLEKLAQAQKTLADDEARDRENLTALKGNDAAKRFVDELNHAEDALDTARKDQADLEKQRDAARAHLDELIAATSFDADLDLVLPWNEDGD